MRKMNPPTHVATMKRGVTAAGRKNRDALNAKKMYEEVSEKKEKNEGPFLLLQVTGQTLSTFIFYSYKNTQQLKKLFYYFDEFPVLALGYCLHYKDQ